jgi:hypothetical protein
VVKTVKTFRARWPVAGGVIRVVIVREETGWLAYFCTDPTVRAADVLETMAGRTAIKQTFKDVNLIVYSLVEARAWRQWEEELVVGPVWDEERRPSPADKRRALQREILRGEIRAAVGETPQWQEFQHLATRLLDLAA